MRLHAGVLEIKSLTSSDRGRLDRGWQGMVVCVLLGGVTKNAWWTRKIKMGLAWWRLTWWTEAKWGWQGELKIMVDGNKMRLTGWTKNGGGQKQNEADRVNQKLWWTETKWGWQGELKTKWGWHGELGKKNGDDMVVRSKMGLTWWKLTWSTKTKGGWHDEQKTNWGWHGGQN